MGSKIRILPLAPNVYVWRKMLQEKQNCFLSALFGFAIGDAMGVPFEFKTRGSFHCKGFTEYGTHNQQLGTWSDDTSMVLATLDALSNAKPSSKDDWLIAMMKNFEKWCFENAFTAHDNVFDCGNTIYGAIKRFHNGTNIHECGYNQEYNNGNGALMRIFPLAFLDVSDKQIDACAGLTHSNDFNLLCCEYYIKMFRYMVLGDKSEEKTLLADIQYLKSLSEEDIKSSGYVFDTLKASLWSFCTSNSYTEAILKAVNLGEDTDTIAALTGALAGGYYGFSENVGVSITMFHQLARYELIQNIGEAFVEKYL